MSAPTVLPITGVYGTAGVSALVLAANTTRQHLMIHNPSTTASLAFTLDGTTPVVNGQGITMGPLGAAFYDSFIATGAVTMIGSGPYTIYWA